MSEQPISTSIVHPSSRITNLNRTSTASEDECNQIIKQLESTVETFRNRNSSKTSTITSILGILGEDSDVSITQSQKEATFDSYLTKILSIQSTFEESNGIDVPRAERSQHLTIPGKVSPKRNFRKQRDIADPESDNDDDKPTKKQKLLESDMPWTSESDDSSVTYSDPNCKETCRLLRTYNQDISKAKFFIKIAPNSPSGIPSSQ